MAFKVVAKAKALESQGRDIIHLEVGEPDFVTPPNVLTACIHALQSGNTRYTPPAGIPQLREAIAAYISRTRGIQVDPSMVVVTPGSKLIIFFSILALVNAGDEVLYPDPGFPIYESMIQFVGGKGVPIPLNDANNFRLDLDRFEASLTSRTRMVILNSPANPTGSVIASDDMHVLGSILADRKDVMILSDEIYSRILYEGEYSSPTQLPGVQERTILLDGFSKTYAMTGWRLGYGVMRADLAEYITRLMVNSASCTPAFIQFAGVEALMGSQDNVESMIAAYRERRKVIVDGLNVLPGVRCVIPQGAFYVFPNIEGTGRTAENLANELLEHAGVAVVPGTAFGHYGEDHLRLSYATSLTNIHKALERMAKVLR